MATAPNVLTAIVEQGDKTLGFADYTAKGFRAVTGMQAFRSYSWMTDVRALNEAGNFRGMVVSARWATAYNVVSKAGDVVGTVATVASIASNAMQMAPQFEEVYRSNDNATIKGLRYVSLSGTVAQRTLAGIVTGGVHLIYLPLIMGCGAVAKSESGTKIGSAAGVCSAVVNNADALVKSSADYVTDPNNQQIVIRRVISIFIK
jgi:hypothetical protein